MEQIVVFEGGGEIASTKCAKEMLMLDDVDNSMFLKNVFETMYLELPESKAIKKQKTEV